MAICPECNSQNVWKKGYNSNGDQRFKCQQCQEHFVECDTNEQVEVVGDTIKFDQKGDTATGTIVTKNQPKKVKDMIELFDVDEKIWSVERFVTNSWDVTNSEGNVYTNYQTKIWFKRNNIAWSYDEIKKDFIEFADKIVPKYEKINYNFKKQKENNLLEINIADLHLGKLCWHREVGENYDVNIAQDRFFKILDQIMYRVSVFDYNRILFPIGNDFFNTDNMFNTTTKGTPQDNDVRWIKLYKLGRELLIKAIDFLTAYAPVDVVVIPGNHDFERMFYVGDSLDVWYSKNENVTVNNSPKLRKYYDYGNVLLGFTHGSEEKVADLPLIMAQEQPELWGKTKYRELQIGHLHHTKKVSYITTNEYKGVVVRQLKSPSGVDAWHYKKGFIGTIKGAEAFVWNDRNGLVSSININI